MGVAAPRRISDAKLIHHDDRVVVGLKTRQARHILQRPVAPLRNNPDLLVRTGFCEPNLFGFNMQLHKRLCRVNRDLIRVVGPRRTEINPTRDHPDFFRIQLSAGRHLGHAIHVCHRLP